MTEGKPVVLVLRYIRYLVTSQIRHKRSVAQDSPCVLRFVGSDDREKVVSFKESTCSCVAEEVRATADVIVYEAIQIDETSHIGLNYCSPVGMFFAAKVFQRIRPKQIAHQA